MGINNPFAARYTRGAGNRVKWEASDRQCRDADPQFLMGSRGFHPASKLVFRDVTNGTNERTIISCALPALPCGNVLGVLRSDTRRLDALVGLFGSLPADWLMRQRISGTHLNYFVIEEMPLPHPRSAETLIGLVRNVIRVNWSGRLFAPSWAAFTSKGVVSNRNCLHQQWALTEHEIARTVAMIDAISASVLGFEANDLIVISRECDFPTEHICNKSLAAKLYPKAFWRVDKSKPPERRQPILALAAFGDLTSCISACGGDVEKGIEAFCSQNDGEGWMLPETLRLADYGLGHDDRAKEHQPVRECFGPRFYDWQLAQTPEESWRECHLHARNLLGPEGYQALLDELEGKAPPVATTVGKQDAGVRGKLFETEHLPLFDERD